MAGWLHSGTRRDACALLYEAGEFRGQQLKAALEAHYDLRLDPRRFYGVLDRLVESGHVERRTEGVHDVYALTDRGERGVREQYAWLTARVESET